jgi:hypothetical protein
MVRRESFINKIRTLGYTYKTQQKRTYLWRQSGTTNYMSVPMSDWLEDEYVRSALRQAGCSKEDIKSFIASAKS